MFTQRALKASYVHKGQAAKDKDPKDIVKYVQVFGDTSMIGEEGVDAEVPTKSAKGTPYSTAAIELTLVAQVPSLVYDYNDAAKRANAARQKLAKRQASADLESPPTKRRSQRGKDKTADDANNDDADQHDPEPTHATRSQTSKARVKKTSKGKKTAAPKKAASAEEHPADTSEQPVKPRLRFATIHDPASGPITSATSN